MITAEGSGAGTSNASRNSAAPRSAHSPATADLHFRARRLHRGTRVLPIAAPHLYPSLADDDFASFRGATDGFALRLSHSDAALHRSLMPAEPVARLVFELLEQQRVESLVRDAGPARGRTCGIASKPGRSPSSPRG